MSVSRGAAVQARGPKKHLKHLLAPKHWMLDKMGGAWAPRPSTGPHKLRECLPLIVIIRNRLKYALNRREAVMISMQKLVQVDGKVRTDPNFPAGLMDVVTIGNPEAKTADNALDRFRLMCVGGGSGGGDRGVAAAVDWLGLGLMTVVALAAWQLKCAVVA
jgi:hypothetical protein